LEQALYKKVTAQVRASFSWSSWKGCWIGWDS